MCAKVRWCGETMDFKRWYTEQFGAQRLFRLRHLVLPCEMKSGTQKYPNPVGVLNAAVDTLEKLGKLYCALFRCKGCKCRWLLGWSAEVFALPSGFSIKIRYPFLEPIQTVFSNKGILIPESWCLQKFKPRKKAVFEISIADKETVAPIIDIIFRRLHGCAEDYVLFCAINLCVEG